MSDFARNLPYGATKPRPHNAVGAPEDENPAGDGPALAVVPEADAGEFGAEVAVEPEAAEPEAVEPEAPEREAAEREAAEREAAEFEAGDADGAEETADPDAEADAAEEAEAEAVTEDAEFDTAAEAEEAAEPAPVAECDESAPVAGAAAEGEDGAEAAAAEVAEPESPLPGETTIADEVVEKVAGIAVRKVPGVHDLGGDASRLVSTVRERIGLGEGSSGRGISVKLSGRAAKLAVTLVVEYGHAVYQVADQVRKDVGDAVEKMLGIEVTELNIVVDDVHVPDA